MKNHIVELIGKDIRLDERKLEEFRNITVEVGVSSKAEGSARVKLGDTEVIVGDPSFRSKKYWKVKLSTLIEGMDKKYDGCYRSFWIISKRRLK